MAKKKRKPSLTKVTLQASAMAGDPWLMLASPVEIDEVISQKFRKAVMKIGKYVKDSEGLEFEVTSGTLENWVAQFQEMTDNGVRIPIPNTHAGHGDPDKNRGYVDDLFIDGDSLVMTCEMIGQDAIDAAARSDVSISSPPKFVDGKGNVYSRPIVHVALCTDPVVPDLGEFVPIAASLAANKETEMEWTKVQKALGVEDELTDDTAVDVICSSFEALKKEVIDIKASAAKAEEDRKKADDGKTVNASLVADPITVKLLADNRTLKLNALVSAAKITPAVRDKMAKKFTDKVAIEAELKAGGRMEEFDLFLEVMAENDPVKLREQSGPQLMELSREAGDGKADFLVKDAEKRAKAAQDMMSLSG